MNIDKVIKNAVNSDANRKEEPIKINFSKEEVESMLKMMKDEDVEFITFEYTPASAMPLYKISKSWDGPFTDITDYGSF